MIYLGLFILVFTLLQFVVAVVNLLTVTHLPHKALTLAKKVSVLIPARNEEHNISLLLEDLSNQRYRNFELIVFNDQSDDGTADTVRNFNKGYPRISLINSYHLPEGWIGKNYACHSLAEHADGDYMLYLDADVRIGPDLICDSVCFAEKTGSELVSIFPKQLMGTAGEQVTVPNMNYILLSLLPLVLVRKSGFPSLAAANGQFMLFKTSAYNELKPHRIMRDNKVEDIAISRFYKKQGKAVSCLLGDDRIMCRMYDGFQGTVYGFSKNVTEFFGNSYLLAILFWLITTFGFIVVLAYLPLWIFGIYIAVCLLTRAAISVSSRQNVLRNLICILPLQVSMGMFIWKSVINRIKGKYIWKGRNIK
jgi:glycosyltransferase involved in cell wall biosynthesis